MSKGAGVSITADLSPIIGSISGFEAMNESLKKVTYTSNLMKVAHGVAVEEFNLTAAAAGATGSIAHMYEWGTLGISRGRSNMRPKPDSPKARLWEDYIKTEGFKNTTIGYTFRPSIALVPNPTKRDTGMSTEVIAKLRRHVFWNKAYVMETGQIVHIARKEAEALLIPLKKRSSGGTSSRAAQRRGYVLTKKGYNAQPGAAVSNNFTSLWMGFWNGLGAKMMDDSVQEQVEMDFREAVENRFSKSGVPTKFVNVTAKVKAGANKISAKAEANAALRAKGLKNG